MKPFLLTFFMVLIMVVLIPNAFTQESVLVPDWIKNNAGWWADGQIDDSSFVAGLQWLISNGIIVMPPTEQGTSSDNVIPDWIKNNAGWWADGQIDDSSFVAGLQWLISNGIIKIPEKCMFEGEEYSHLFDSERKLLCEEFNLEFVNEYLTKSGGSVTYNSEGFRGPEFLKEKPDNTYRIFVLGGSTTFGDGNDDDETWPHYLQEIFDIANLSYNVEIINAGISSAWSGSETKLIKEKILDYNPDMLMIYDGWNDVRMQLGELQGRIAEPEMANPTLWKDRWVESCKFTNANNVKTIVTLQPFLGTGERIFSNQEMGLVNTHTTWIKNDVKEYAKYRNQLEEISKHCTETKDLTRIFDQVDKSIYWDLGHVGSEANKIIATHFFKLALQYIPENEVMPSEITRSFLEEPSTKFKHISKELDLRGMYLANKDFTNQDLREYAFGITRLQNINFSNANLENVNFLFGIIDGGSFNDTNLKNAILSRTMIVSSDFSSADLTNVNMSGAKIVNTKFTNSILSNSKFIGATLQNTNFDNTNLENSVFERSKLMKIDIWPSADKTKNMEIHNSYFWEVNFNGVDFSEIIVGSTNSFAGSDFRNSNLPTLDLVDIDFSSKFSTPIDGTRIYVGGANLSNLDFTNTDVSKVVFSHLDTFGEEYQNIDTRDKIRDIDSVHLSGANLSDTDLSNKNLTLVVFYNANLSNADLSNADLRYADLRNADLSGADLTNANLEFADLHGATLDNTILKCTNHSICD